MEKGREGRGKWSVELQDLGDYSNYVVPEDSRGNSHFEMQICLRLLKLQLDGCQNHTVHLVVYIWLLIIITVEFPSYFQY